MELWSAELEGMRAEARQVVGAGMAAIAESFTVGDPPADPVARAQHQREIMAIRHKRHPVFGLQFHPESFLTHAGVDLLKRFLDISLRTETPR